MQQQAMDAAANLQPTQTTDQPPPVNSNSSSSTLQAMEAAIKPHVISPEAAAAALQLQEEQRWDVAVDVVQQLGDPETAARIRAERNNWYRLQRVLQILVQNGGKPLSQLDVDTTKELDYDFRWAWCVLGDTLSVCNWNLC
jgi:tRNA A37 N6-isopentenylltransferase MiaA